MSFNQNLEPPVMAKKPHTTAVHGLELEDPYFWFRYKEDPAVIEHLKAENTYVEQVLEPYSSTVETIWQELKSRIKEEDQSYPSQLGDYFYYSKDLPGQEHKVYCRRQGSMTGEEEVILDLNELAKGEDYLQLGVIEISPDNNVLAYSIDTDGSEKFKLYFKNLTSGRLYKHHIENTYPSMKWCNDSQTLYYMSLNENLRPDRVFRYCIGTHRDTSELIYKEESNEFFVSLSKTRSKNYVVINCFGAITSECHLLDANDTGCTPQLVSSRLHGTEYTVEDGCDGNLFIHTNNGAKNFKIMTTKLNSLAIENWQDYLSHDKDIYLLDFEIFKTHIVLFERVNGLKRMRLIVRENKSILPVELPEENCQINSYTNPDFDSADFKFSYCSLITPASVLSIEFASGQIYTLKAKEIPTYDKSKYTTKRVFAKGHDGTPIPMSLVYKKDLKKDCSNPVYLYGYGSYSINMSPDFRTTMWSLVDRGFVYAIAHIRGGSEMGRQWYEDGKLMKKKNTFLDFISCAEHLVSEGFTTEGQIAICGGSAGGLLMGATINLRPELFKVVAAHVPFVDVINTMLDDSLPLTTIEYDEWGNPREKDVFNYIRSYSPYDNIGKHDYPHIFVTAGLNDPRVTYWEPAKWVAKLREYKTDKNTVVLKTNLEAGHRGKSGRFEGLKEYAEEYAFILAAFDMIKPS